MALQDVAIMDMPAAKQSFLLKPENRSTYYKLGYALSAKCMMEQGGKSICNIPDSYDDPEHKVVQRGVFFGRNLDGIDGSSENSCGEQDFVSPNGVSGIDNQLYRVMGCVDSYRRTSEFAGGAFEDYHTRAYRDGEVTTLMEITGVDDRRNDEDVTVKIYSSGDATPYDARKEGIPYGSMTVSDNKLWHNTVKGRIVDGKLEPETFGLRLKFGFTGRRAEYLIKDSRVNLTLNQDGTAKGDLAGYFDTRHAYWHAFHDAQGAFQVANGFTCPAVWDVLWRYSDGHPDPETGQCTYISTALTIKAVPAFVIRPPESELEFYFYDTSKYYGVPEEIISVAGAESRAINDKIGPPASRTKDKKKDAQLV